MIVIKIVIILLVATYVIVKMVLPKITKLALVLVYIINNHLLIYHPYYLFSDINECQVGQHDCREGQRCDNTIGSYLCSRTTGCGTGYTLNSATGLCEDDDECLLGLHNCHDLGPKFQCRNTAGSYRCERIKCIGDCYTKKVYTSTSFLPARVVPTHVYPIITQLKKCLPGYTMNQLGECQGMGTLNYTSLLIY